MELLTAAGEISDPKVSDIPTMLFFGEENALENNTKYFKYLAKHLLDVVVLIEH